MAEFLNLFSWCCSIICPCPSACVQMALCFVPSGFWVKEKTNKPLRKPGKVCLKLSNNPQIWGLYLYTLIFYVLQIGKRSWESLRYTGSTTGRRLSKSKFHTEVHLIRGKNVASKQWQSWDHCPCPLWRATHHVQARLSRLDRPWTSHPSRGGTGRFLRSLPTQNHSGILTLPRSHLARWDQ